MVVIGAGHAGIEAAFACARMGLKTLMLTLRADSVGRMSCNPAIGGVGKGQLVKEIDALGGLMGRAADSCAIQFRVLNASKGPAVRSSRAQIDMDAYNRYMVEAAGRQENLDVAEAEAKGLVVRDGQVYGVRTNRGEVSSRAVVVSSGTFLDGLIHVGMRHYSAGRIDEPAAICLAGDLKALGFRLFRFKTGTCPRLEKDSIDFSRLTIQEGDDQPLPFSFSTTRILRQQVPCYIAYTNETTHRIIRENLHVSPLYSGLIRATGVRYCPSIEDKVVKFADRKRHQLFLEPQGLSSVEVYPNGLSTSLPEEVQLRMVRSIEGLEEAKVRRFGYGIEHTVIDSTQLFPTLESKPVKNLYFAGQVNGTTGYEEAAAQGLIAGINAALRVQRREPFVLDRSTSYIGVLIDDLTTKGTNEPYRMFTSRVEYRLLLREDNADLRLRAFGRDLGLVSETEYLKTVEKEKALKEARQRLKERCIKPARAVNAWLTGLGTPALRKSLTLEELLRRPQVTLRDLLRFSACDLELPEEVLRQLELETKYSGFIQRQVREVERFKNLESVKIPPEIDYSAVRGLSREIEEKLSAFRPLNLGQASRICGVTPVALSLLMVYLRKLHAGK